MEFSSLHAWLTQAQLEDAWWVGVDGVLQDKVIPLDEVTKLLTVNCHHEIAVLHVSRAATEDENWVIVEPDSLRLSANGTAQVAMPDLVRMESRLEALAKENAALHRRLDGLEQTLELLKEPIMDAFKIIEERSQELEKAEGVMLSRFGEHERFVAEVEQLKENLVASGIEVPAILDELQVG